MYNYVTKVNAILFIKLLVKYIHNIHKKFLVNYKQSAIVFKTRCTCGRMSCVPGFLKLLWPVCQYAFVCVCLPLTPLITSHMKGTRNNQIMKFYSYSISLYDIVVNKLNRRGLSNTAGHESLPKKSQVMQY